MKQTVQAKNHLCIWPKLFNSGVSGLSVCTIFVLKTVCSTLSCVIMGFGNVFALGAPYQTLQCCRWGTSSGTSFGTPTAVSVSGSATAMKPTNIKYQAQITYIKYEVPVI